MSIQPHILVECLTQTSNRSWSAFGRLLPATRRCCLPETQLAAGADPLSGECDHARLGTAELPRRVRSARMGCLKGAGANSRPSLWTVPTPRPIKRADLMFLMAPILRISGGAPAATWQDLVQEQALPSPGSSELQSSTWYQITKPPGARGLTSRAKPLALVSNGQRLSSARSSARELP
jgi:hypothetical protein